MSRTHILDEGRGSVSGGPGLDPMLLDRLLRHERAFVLALGGYAVEVPGAHLVVHERLPAPRLNFVQVVNVPETRQAAFFERALDHYFQRAIRPSFRVASPVPPHLDRGLRGFGFRPSPEAHRLLVAKQVSAPASSEFTVRPARPDELDQIVELWGSPGSREEFRRSLEVLWNFPHPDERIEPLLAVDGRGGLASAAVLYASRRITGIYAVATSSSARKRGAATALVEAAARRPIAVESDLTYLPMDHQKGAERLTQIGFEAVSNQVVYELPREAELALPPAGPAGPPRWRPPRRSVA